MLNLSRTDASITLVWSDGGDLPAWMERALGAQVFAAVSVCLRDQWGGNVRFVDPPSENGHGVRIFWGLPVEGNIARAYHEIQRIMPALARELDTYRRGVCRLAMPVIDVPDASAREASASGVLREALIHSSSTAALLREALIGIADAGAGDDPPMTREVLQACIAVARKALADTANFESPPGAMLIYRERQRQIYCHGRTAHRDATVYEGDRAGELLRAAANCLGHAYRRLQPTHYWPAPAFYAAPALYGRAVEAAPRAETTEDFLVVAGALIAAELDRLALVGQVMP